jgi:hypothetical protein
VIGVLGKGRYRQQANEILQELREVLALALGAARTAHDRAEVVHAQREFELWVMRNGLSVAEADPKLADKLVQPELREVWNRLLRERSEIYGSWTQNGPAELAELVSEFAPGPAGRPWPDWLGTVGTSDGTTPPRLWRVAAAVVEDAPQTPYVRPAHGGPASMRMAGSSHAHEPPADGREFPLAVPLLDVGHLRIVSAKDTRPSVDALVEALLVRILSTFAPGLVRVHIWDIGQLTTTLPNLYPLTTAGLLTVHDPTRPEDLLAELSGHVRRVHSNTMRAGHTSLRTASDEAGRRIEPWRIVVMFGNGERLAEEQQRELQTLARNGLYAGVHLILVDVPISVNSPMETVTLVDGKHGHSTMTGRGVTVRLDAPIPGPRVSRAATSIAAELTARRGKPRTFEDLLPTVFSTESSAVELRAPVGFDEGELVEITIGDATPHVLIAGPSGSGKTNFLYTMIGSLAARYSPAELELYLLDFKEGVSFAGLAPGSKDPSWLPQARLVGVNVNADREFGLALLRFLADELARRAAAAKREEVTKLADLREADPTGHWPRIVAVIDEFQVLFSGRDRLTATATALLEDVARRGRSQGIHLVLASQDIAGIEAFWGKPAVFEQCTLRIAMPKAKRVLTEDNPAAVSLARWHAVINHDSGVIHGNQHARIPDASARGTFDTAQRRLWQERPPSVTTPRLFDGSHIPRLTDAADFGAEPANGAARPLLGQIIDVDDRCASVELDATPGRNIAVLGTATGDALSIMDSAALSLARQHFPGSCQFSIWCAVPSLGGHVERVAATIDAAGHQVALSLDDGVAQQCARLAETSGPHYVLWYAADAALQRLSHKDIATMRSGLDDVRAMLKQGPAKRVHTIAWWRSIARMKETLGFGAGDEIGAWVALDVQGNELTSLAGGQVVDWSPRSHRAVFFDRSTHAHPNVIVPFDTSSALVEWSDRS